MHISEAGFLIFLSPQMPALRRGFNVKWLGFIVLQENKTVRAFSKVSWSCQKDTEDKKKKKWRLKRKRCNLCTIKNLPKSYFY